MSCATAMWIPALHPLKFPLLDLLPFVLLASATVDLDPSANLDALGNNTLFAQWRPRYHFSAPAGWMNVTQFGPSFSFPLPPGRRPLICAYRTPPAQSTTLTAECTT